MNLLLLLLGVRAWSGSPIEVLTRVFCAVSLFALEMQFVTWTGLATLRSLAPVNAVIAAGLFIWLARRDRSRETERNAARSARQSGPTSQRWLVASRSDATFRETGPADTVTSAASPGVWLPFAAIGALVLLLNAVMPLEAADHYHLERIDRIQQLGTLAYDPGADPKVNILGWLYELVLADLGTLPVAGPLVVKFHGAIGLVLYAVTSAAVLRILGPALPAAGWLMAVVPVVFHQLVMVKNDLFGAIPAVLVLGWIVTRGRDAPPEEGTWAGWLTGIAIGIKLTSFPLALVFAGALLIEHRHNARLVALSLAGVMTGLVAAGVLFLLVENVEVYGASVAPYGSLGNRTAGVADAAVSVGRFAVSLVDMGLFTGTFWPGRGGWGGTYGLPLIWALGVLACAHRTPLAQRTLVVCGAYWAAFAAVYPDADVAHRLALAPGVLAVAAAAAAADRDPRVPRWLRRLALPVVILSAAQIIRSTLLYLARG